MLISIVSFEMSQGSRFKFRFMRLDEAKRLAELIGELQRYQQLHGVLKLPSQSDVLNTLFREDHEGNLVPNNLGTFTALAIDTSAPDGPDKLNIVGYLVYSLSFSLRHGRQFYINSFFIEEPYRRHGLGRKLIGFLQRHAEMLGITLFDVPFMKKNIVGQKFYQSFGAYLVDEEYNLFGMRQLGE